jgi:hypothetical protein
VILHPTPRMLAYSASASAPRQRRSSPPGANGIAHHIFPPLFLLRCHAPKHPNTHAPHGRTCRFGTTFEGRPGAVSCGRSTTVERKSLPRRRYATTVRSITSKVLAHASQGYLTLIHIHSSHHFLHHFHHFHHHLRLPNCHYLPPLEHPLYSHFRLLA